ncbi:MAG: DUF2269 family protein [Pseudomonadales bacterium]|nr:DUF2269 family protein [Pseudomonadales bacterium]
MYRQLVRFLHQLGAVGVLGALATCVVLVATAPTDSLAAYAGTRHGIAMISKWLLVPSLLVVLISGLLAIAGTRAYMDAGWVWMKVLLGLAMFEGTLITISATASRAAELTAQAAAGQSDPARLEAVLRTEWGGLWVLIAVSVANIVLAVWRPRFSRRPAER